MKNFLNSIIVFVFAIISVSCGVATKTNMVSSTALDKDNFIYARNVSAKISYTYILGIGGLTKKDIVEKLTDNANLVPGEALVNVGIQSKLKIYLGVVMIKEFFATGQVIRFTDGNSTDCKTSALLEKYETLSNRFSGYDGDLLSALPVASVNVKYGELAERTMAKLGIPMAPEEMSRVLSSSLRHAVDSTSQNVMNVTIVHCDTDIMIHGYADIIDKNGNIISSIVVEGVGIDRRREENPFISAFNNAGKKICRKWYDLVIAKERETKK